MAKAKKTKREPKVVIEESGKLPSAGSNWPFADLQVSTDKRVFAFYVDQSLHQAVRTAATRAGKKLGRTFSVRKIKDPNHPHNGEIGVFRLN